MSISISNHKNLFILFIFLDKFSIDNQQVRRAAKKNPVKLYYYNPVFPYLCTPLKNAGIAADK
jgi:hypothetical protein